MAARLDRMGLRGCVQPYPFGPSGGVLSDRRPSVEVAGGSVFRAEKLDRFDRIVWAHGVKIANGNNGEVETAHCEELHFEEQGRIAGEIEALFGVTQSDEKPQGSTAVGAIGHARTMVRDRRFHVAKWQVDRTPGVHADELSFWNALLGEPLADFEIRNHLGAGALGDTYRVAQMIEVTMRKQDEIGFDILGFNRCGRGVVQKRIDEDRGVRVFDAPGIVTEPSYFGCHRDEFVRIEVESRPHRGQLQYFLSAHFTLLGGSRSYFVYRLRRRVGRKG